MEEKKTGSAGEQFVKKLRPVGCILFLAISVLTLIVCLSSKGLPVEGYTAPNTSEYYAEHLDELEEELNENLIPLLDGVLTCQNTGEKIQITFEADKIAIARSNILHYYDAELFDFVKIENTEEE